MDEVIRARGLSKRFGRTVALDDVNLTVPRGVVFGYLGPNGAGKTTTIRSLMGLVRPSGGSVEVFGMDAFRQRDRIHRRVGYLSGEFVAYPDLTCARYLRYFCHLRGFDGWSDVELLAKRLELDLGARIGSLSHGSRQKVGLIQAFMHQPDLLMLDEPTIGLDPLMQREFVAMVREARAAGTTVFLSSHILDEVEAVADMVGIVRGGCLVAVDSVDALKEKARRHLTLTFAGETPAAELRSVPGVTEVHVEDGIAHVAIAGSMEELLRVAAPFGIRTVTGHDVDLEEIFLAHYAKEA